MNVSTSPIISPPQKGFSLTTEQYKLLGIGLLGLSALLFVRHRTMPETDYSTSGYENVSPMKHDFFKAVVVELVPLLFYPISAKNFYNPDDIWNSFVGRMAITVGAYGVYYQLVEPYLVARTAQW
jgi:hypothetical protein